jgi:hypothetical protein
MLIAHNREFKGYLWAISILIWRGIGREANGNEIRIIFIIIIKYLNIVAKFKNKLQKLYFPIIDLLFDRKNS